MTTKPVAHTPTRTWTAPRVFQWEFLRSAEIELTPDAKAMLDEWHNYLVENR